MTDLIQIGSSNFKSYSFFLVLMGFVCSTPLPMVRAQNTNVGTPSFSSNTTGTDDSAFGWKALDGNTTGSQNTALGTLALQNNTVGGNNTAAGHAALQESIIFDANHIRISNNGSRNTSFGDQAISSLVAGNDNTATGYRALLSNTWGNNNTAVGSEALRYYQGIRNTVNSSVCLGACNNTAVGTRALWGSTHYSNGSNNTAAGYEALKSNDSGTNNTADGFSALINNVAGSQNTGIGYYALLRSTGSYNISLGQQAGANLTGGDSNIYVGSIGPSSQGSETGVIRIGTKGTANGQQDHNTYIAGIYGTPISGSQVVVDASGHLGTLPPSSRRFKDDIKPMNQSSEALLSLRPVSFRYKHEVDPNNMPQFGLVAEEVEKVNPDLITRDEEGKPYSVRYDAVNAMLLNEFLKEHRKVEEQGEMIAKLEKQIETLSRGLERITAEITAPSSTHLIAGGR